MINDGSEDNNNNINSQPKQSSSWLQLWKIPAPLSVPGRVEHPAVVEEVEVEDVEVVCSFAFGQTSLSKYSNLPFLDAGKEEMM